MAVTSVRGGTVSSIGCDSVKCRTVSNVDDVTILSDKCSAMPSVRCATISSVGQCQVLGV